MIQINIIDYDKKTKKSTYYLNNIESKVYFYKGDFQ